MVQQVKPLDLQGDRSDCDDGVKSFAEFSRPARELKVKLSNWRRKPQGRKQKNPPPVKHSI